MLVNQTKNLLDGNKNKTGCLDGVSHSIEQDVNMSNQNTLVDMVNTCSPVRCSGDHSKYMTLDSVVNVTPSNEGSSFPHVSDSHWKPHLASLEKNLEGNKNKNGSLDGVNARIRNVNKEDIVLNVSTTAGVCEQVPTADSDTILNGNCDHNILQFIECDGNLASKNIPKVLLNGVTNQIHTFGFCPLTPLQLYTGDPVKWDCTFTDIEAHKLIKESGKPNLLGCRIPVDSHLNISNYRSYLSNYWDAQLPDLLEFGFPLDFSRKSTITSTEQNHASALQNPLHVQAYIDEEISFKAMLGPFNTKPIPLHVSPLMVRDKQDSNKKRTIMDLSWPKGASVNASVQKDIYLGTQYALNYPSIDSITYALCKLGPAAKFYKIDIGRAFRQIKIDPMDIDLLGLKFQNK